MRQEHRAVDGAGGERHTRRPLRSRGRLLALLILLFLPVAWGSVPEAERATAAATRTTIAARQPTRLPRRAAYPLLRIAVLENCGGRRPRYRCVGRRIVVERFGRYRRHSWRMRARYRIRAFARPRRVLLCRDTVTIGLNRNRISARSRCRRTR